MVASFIIMFVSFDVFTTDGPQWINKSEFYQYFNCYYLPISVVMSIVNALKHTVNYRVYTIHAKSQ